MNGHRFAVIRIWDQSCSQFVVCFIDNIALEICFLFYAKCRKYISSHIVVALLID